MRHKPSSELSEFGRHDAVDGAAAAGLVNARWPEATSRSLGGDALAFHAPSGGSSVLVAQAWPRPGRERPWIVFLRPAEPSPAPTDDRQPRLSAGQMEVLTHLQGLCRRHGNHPVSTPSVSRCLDKAFDDWSLAKLKTLETKGLVERLGVIGRGARLWRLTPAGQAWTQD